jgi:hypothetical protein
MGPCAISVPGYISHSVTDLSIRLQKTLELGTYLLNMITLDKVFQIKGI